MSFHAKSITRIFTLVFCLGFVNASLSDDSPSFSKAGDIVALNSKTASTNKDLSRSTSLLIDADNKFQSILKEGVMEAALRHKIEAEIKKVSTPETLAPLFLKQRVKSDYQYRNEKVDPAGGQNMMAATTAAESGGIRGKVSVEGSAPTEDVIVLAFDEYGYFAGENTASEDGSYSITGLKAGQYYVMTWSNYYVDELYNNVMAPLASREAWRTATKVNVPQDTIVEEVNFDLLQGAQISGVLKNPEGTPLAFQSVEFVVTSALAPVPILSQLTQTTFDGHYELRVPVVGSVKIEAMAEGFYNTWYSAQENWETAQAVNIVALATPVDNIDFTLQAIPAEMLPGSIAGSITAGGLIKLPIQLGAAVAFNAADTSLAGLGVVLFLGQYEISDLPPGNYYVFGNDLAGNLLGTSNYLGEFYDGSYTLAGAKTVEVKANEQTAGINFTLEPGGTIAGKVTDWQGTPLDSIMVVAVNANVLDDAAEPLITRINLGAVNTDTLGNYVMDGMPAGEYILRSVSALPEAVAEILAVFGVSVNKHAGEVVDEYYQNVYNLLRIDDAERVPVEVPNTTAGIDFVLDRPGFFTGTVTDAVSGEAVTNVLLVALNDTSGYPYLPLGEIGEDGSYQIGPLPFGKYKLLALAGLENNVPYLTEFYDGARYFYDAQVLDLQSAEYANINFTLDRGAIIQGLVDLAEGGSELIAGADTLDGFPVLAYYAETGKLASYDYVQFAGGYRIDKLYPGSYKVMALPAVPPFAITYYGGGVDFEDNNSQVVSLSAGQVFQANIELRTATGSISGKVVHKETGTPLSLVMVLAYDKSGHPVGMAMTDFDLASGLAIGSTGVYRIGGLRPGQYYLRTFALSTAFALQGGLANILDFVNEFDISKLLAGDFDLFDLSLNTFADYWYPSDTTRIVLNLHDFLLQFASYGVASEYDNALLPVHLPLPFDQTIPPGALAVTVNAGQETGNIDFTLTSSELEDLIELETAVVSASANVPKQFALYQNYPNPFNPLTTFRFALPGRSHVQLRIYDLLGREIETLVNDNLPAGDYSIRYNAADLPSGVYIYRLQADHFVSSRKFVLLK